MTSIHEYENWLDEIERRIIIADGAIRANFKKQYSIPLEACNTPKKALCQAQAFSANLLSNEEGLPWDTLAVHMLRIAGEANQLSIDAENLYHGSKIRFAGDFECAKTAITRDGSKQMEFKNARSNYLKLTLFAPIVKTGKNLKPHKLHCFTSSMYEFAEAISLGVILMRGHIILCLPEGVKWRLYDGGDLQPSGWHGQESTRLALGFTDPDALESSYFALRKFLGKGILKEPPWSVNLERQVK